MGREGLKKAAVQSASKAHYMQEKLKEAGFEPKYEKTFFNEFVTKTPVDTSEILKALEEKGILGGLPLAADEMLWCATEKNSRKEIDDMVQLLKEVCR